MKYSFITKALTLLFSYQVIIFNIQATTNLFKEVIHLSKLLTECLFNKELIKINQPYESQKEFFRDVSTWLYDKNFITDTFFEAITNREEQFPTGLHTSIFDVAIPHTDPSHIQKPFIAVVRPESPVNFKEMGNLDGNCAARLIFIIGFKHSENQLAILQRLMQMFSDRKTMDVCLNTTNVEEMYHTLTRFCKDDIL